MKKVLISRGYGAGWSSWNNEGVGKFMAEYEPIIELVEKGEILTENHSVVLQMVKEIQEKYNKNYVCLLGLGNLEVESVSGPYKIREYDGAEWVEEKDNEEWW